MTIRLMIRGYLRSELKFALPRDVDSDYIDSVVAEMARKHAAAMAAGELTMIEIEFLDEPNPLERFFRIGVDPTGMVRPVEIKLDNLIKPAKS